MPTPFVADAADVLLVVFWRSGVLSRRRSAALSATGVVSSSIAKLCNTNVIPDSAIFIPSSRNPNAKKLIQHNVNYKD